MFKLFSIVSIIAFVLLGVVIGLLNPTAVELNLFVMTVTLPLSVIMSGLLVVGMAIGGLIVFMQVMKLRWALHGKIRENQKLSDQIVQLKKQNIEEKERQAKQESPNNNLPAIN